MGRGECGRTCQSLFDSTPADDIDSCLSPCPFRLNTASLNLGPHSVEWFCVQGVYVQRLRKLLWNRYDTDLYALTEHSRSWLPDPLWLQEFRVPYSRVIQCPGDLIVVDGSSVYWSRSLGFSTDIRWNFAPPTLTNLQRIAERVRDNAALNHVHGIASSPLQSQSHSLSYEHLVLALGKRLIVEAGGGMSPLLTECRGDAAAFLRFVFKAVVDVVHSEQWWKAKLLRLCHKNDFSSRVRQVEPGDLVASRCGRAGCFRRLSLSAVRCSCCGLICLPCAIDKCDDCPTGPDITTRHSEESMVRETSDSTDSYAAVDTPLNANTRFSDSSLHFTNLSSDFGVAGAMKPYPNNNTASGIWLQNGATGLFDPLLNGNGPGTPPRLVGVFHSSDSELLVDECQDSVIEALLDAYSLYFTDSEITDLSHYSEEVVSLGPSDDLLKIPKRKGSPRGVNNSCVAVLSRLWGFVPESIADLSRVDWTQDERNVDVMGKGKGVKARKRTEKVSVATSRVSPVDGGEGEQEMDVDKLPKKVRGGTLSSHVDQVKRRTSWKSNRDGETKPDLSENGPRASSGRVKGSRKPTGEKDGKESDSFLRAGVPLFVGRF